ncbi:MAG: hypothetical protein HQ574_09105 [Chloroflexi bacterium]|nr:hypothetical protein [Chloroflexota bacterium]
MADKKKTQAGSPFWQIIFPAVIGSLIILLLGAWIVLESNAGTVSRFAEISTVLLVIPVFFSSLLVLIVLGALIYLVLEMIAGLPSITSRILELLEKIQKGAEAISKSITRIFIEPTAFLAGFKRAKTKEDPDIVLKD